MNRSGNMCRRVLTAGLAAVFLFSGPQPLAAEPAVTPEGSVPAGQTQTASVRIGYDEWLAQQAGLPYGTASIRLQSRTEREAGRAQGPASSEGDLLVTEGGSVTFSVSAPAAGLYRLQLGYRAQAGESAFASPIVLSLTVNGAIPYREASRLSLSRVFEPESGAFAQDEYGNDLQPEQREVTPDRVYTLSDSAGYHPNGLYVALKAGDNRVTLTGERSGVIVCWIAFAPTQDVPDYAAYQARWAGEAQENAAAPEKRYEAEAVYRKSDGTISPVTDRSSARVTPNSPRAMRLNTLGGANFSTAGQWVSWQIDVPESGFYTLSLRCKQGVNAGAVASRRLTIDGQVPFREADELVFPYSRDYRTVVLGQGDTAWAFYLPAGRHEIGLEVVLGPMTTYLKQVSAALTALNDDYLRILFYTGSSPDAYRDYGFDKLIPDVLADFRTQADILRAVSAGIHALSASRGNNTATLDRLVGLLTRMSDDPDEIARHFTLFNDSLSALGTWLNTYTAQPLQIDAITVAPAGREPEAEQGSFWTDLWFKCQIFFASYADDYAAASDARELQVWMATGRDQSKIVTRLSRNDQQATGIRAKVSLVAANALLPNVLAGSPVDVYINAAATDPINYAIRGAVLDLTQFDDYEAVARRFHPASLTPFSYRGAVYALPESFDFPLMFYRKDIFETLGLEVPETWDAFYETVALLQKNNLSVGILWSDLFNLILYQSGGRYYTEDLTQSALAQPKALSAFVETAKLYTDYGLPVEFSFPNRFRNGNMPLGIVPYTMYNQLYLFAPEIDGLWEFREVPGTRDGQGDIHNQVLATGTGAILLRTSRDKQAAWDFLKWWTSTETQTQFGIEMEQVMGVAARQSSANLDVVRGFPWSDKERAVIENQWDSLGAAPQIPGSYYMQRTLEFAFNSVYSLGQDPVRALQQNVAQLNEEIDRKMAEFAS